MTKLSILTYFVLFALSCTTEKLEEKSMQQEDRKANSLITESSPYLLQHAYNPVDWMPWNDSTLAFAKKLNKPLLISIGYSACHWCHVMEKESFEDTAVAKLMNENFICIKIDREERPDIDQIYMDAVQLMNGRGGWPLNCFALPDGRPIYGGTYFPKDTWMKLLIQVSDLIKNDPEKVEDYASKLRDGLIASEEIQSNEVNKLPQLLASKCMQQWQDNFDSEYGGMNRAPKFPMPNTLEFLMHYNEMEANSEVENHVYLTLDKMAAGGIYDQLGGGFARYSVDMEWKVPHFEKMLYDNAQLIALYAKAYRKSKNPLYQEKAVQSIAFIERELKAAKGVYYSALDADSEGEEGKFYTWNLEELQNLLEHNFSLLESYYDLQEGKWEKDQIILVKKDPHSALESHPKANALKEIQNKLLEERAKRVHPGLDDKSLTSWNALLLIAYVEAFKSFGNKVYLQRAESIAKFITSTQKKEDGGLWRNFKDGKSNINGFLDDYSFSIEGLLALFTVSSNSNYLEEAKSLIDYCLAHFYNTEAGLFYYTSDKDPALIVRKMERVDNVIPASNSSFAKALFLYGSITSNEELLAISKNMVVKMREEVERYPSTYSNWGSLSLMMQGTSSEIIITGENAMDSLYQIQQEYMPNTLLLAAEKESKLDLFQGKFQEDQTLIYVCKNRSCKKPSTSVKEALESL